MSARRLDVFINDARVGSLQEEDDLWAFEYDANWITAADGFDLSPALPRSVRRHADGATRRPVQWYFDNLLPEEALRTVLAKEAAVAEEDAFGLLQYYGAESAGSLVMRDPDQECVLEGGLRPLADDVLSTRIRGLARLPLTHGAPKHMSLAGAQHKLPVVYKDGRLYEPMPAEVSTHILKPDHQGSDYPASVINEYFVMKLAAAVGLAVPEVRRFYCPEPVYLIARFDRKSSGNRVLRHHVIDACQLLDKSRSFKYRSATLETLGELIARVRVRPQARLVLYRWLVFNILVGNADNHLKNISFMVSSEGVAIAPSYDLLSTAVYATRMVAGERASWPDVPLVLSLPGATHFGDVTRGAMLQAGGQIGLSEATAARELDQMLRVLPAQATRLISVIDAENQLLSAPPGLTRAGEMRLLRAIQHIVIAEMTARLQGGG